MMNHDTTAGSLRAMSRRRVPSEDQSIRPVLRFPTPALSLRERGNLALPLSGYAHDHLAKPSAMSAQQTSRAIRTSAGCSLSPWERVRVRGSGVAFNIVGSNHSRDSRRPCHRGGEGECDQIIHRRSPTCVSQEG